MESPSFETGLLLALAGLFAGLTVAGFALALSLARRRGPGPAEVWMLLQQQLDTLRSDLASFAQHQTDRVERAQDAMGDRLMQASRGVADVRRELGTLQEATQRVLEVGRSVAGIENLLRAPKLRGVLGEVLLGELLQQALPPPLYELQYQLPSGERVDAMLRVGETLLSVDAKFPLENLKRALEAGTPAERSTHRQAFARNFRKHVDDVARKYIAPEQGTLPIAFLYVPAENVYQQGVLAHWELAEYALARRVIPTGPLGFYAFLQTVLLGARSLAVPRRAGEILAGLTQISLDLEQVDRELAKLTRHIELSRATASELGRRVRILGESLARTRSSLDDASLAEPVTAKDA